MIQCMMMRRPHERLTVVCMGTKVAGIVQKAQQVAAFEEYYASEVEAESRFNEIKLIAALDYGFYVFAENFDDQ